MDIEEIIKFWGNIELWIRLLILIAPCFIFLITKNRRLKNELTNSHKTLAQSIDKQEQLLNRYASVINAELHASQLIEDAKDQAQTIIFEAQEIRKAADNEAAEKISKASAISRDSYAQAEQIVKLANEQAEQIAGDALLAKNNVKLYKVTLKAMKNTIEGYKDEYLIPNISVLDQLSDEYSHKAAGEQLKIARQRMRELIKNGQAGECDYVEENRRLTAINFVVDAFNGKVDSALSKVKHDNFGKIQQEIKDAFALVNHNGGAFRNARIKRDFLNARLEELKWAVASFELQKQDREEQRQLREQMREEEKARRDIEKALKEAEKEEQMLQKALEKARKELESANSDQRLQFEEQLAALEIKLQEAEAKGQRAISMAQQTRKGHVYVISNIGSFGENVFKIGMTRRLDPTDRIKELSDASVPFDFDIHAMIYSDDAPSLEKHLHRTFYAESVNKINSRKEFFRLPISQIKTVVEEQGVTDIHWTMKAEATEYRESINLSKINVNQEIEELIEA
ncbi:MAG: DUF4041 domain-containing protein [Enterovibrio sp.]